MKHSIPHFFQERFFLLKQFSSSYSRWISSALSVVCGLLILAFYLQSGPKAAAFAQTQQVFARWMNAPQDEACFAEMVRAFYKIPQLKERYQPILAQKLIEGGKGAEVLDMASYLIGVAKKETPLHAAYAETTLLIEQGKYQVSLERAVALKTKIASEYEIARFTENPSLGGALLYAYNLLRIASLQQELGNRPGEKAAWSELEGFLGSDSQSFLVRSLSQGLEEKGFNLVSYMRERKLALDAGT